MSAIAIDHLTYDEKVELLGQLVDSLEHEAAPLSAVQRAELERRLAKSAAGQTIWHDWQDVKAGLERL